VLRLAGRESVTWVHYADGAPRHSQQMELPFGRATFVGGMNGSLVTVQSGDGELIFFGLNGTPDRSAYRTDVNPPLVSPDLRRRYVEAATEQAVAAGAPPRMASEGAEESLKLLPDGRGVPVYDRMLIDRVAARIWLRDFVPLWSRHDPQTWTVHDERGRVLARLETPTGLDLMNIARDRLVGVSRDEMGVEFVIVHEVAESTP